MELNLGFAKLANTSYAECKPILLLYFSCRMDSIDVYLTKKRKRREYLEQSKKAKVRVLDMIET